MLFFILIIFSLICVIIAGFFSGAETAFVSIDKAVLHSLTSKNNGSAVLAEKILSSPAKMLATTLIGTNLFYVSATTLATLAVSFFASQQWQSLITTAIMTPLILVCAELVPKSIGRNSALAYVLVAAPVVFIAQKILQPFVAMISFLSSGALKLFGIKDSHNKFSITREEVRTLAEISEEHGLIGKTEKKHNIYRSNSSSTDNLHIINNITRTKSRATAHSGVAMNIYHMSYTEKFAGERMAMLSFKGCNFHCIGCIRERTEYDIYAEERRYIDWNFENILKELKALNPHRVYLGGYEPTLDPDLITIIKDIAKLDPRIHIVLMTNGSRIDERYAMELKEAGVNEVIVSVKAFDRDKHLYYTKRSNEPVLNAIKNLAAIEDAYFRLQVETILLPGINEPADIEELAIFISEINPAISLFIEPWIPTPGVEFEEPKKRDLIDAVSRAMKHLYVVSYHPLYSEIKKIRETPVKAKFIEILPKQEQPFS